MTQKINWLRLEGRIRKALREYAGEVKDPASA